MGRTLSNEVVSGGDSPAVVMAVGICRASGDAGISHLSERRSGWLRSQAALSGSDRSHSGELLLPGTIDDMQGHRCFVPLLPRELNLFPGQNLISR